PHVGGAAISFVTGEAPRLASPSVRLQRVFALGTLAYDFGTEVRLDSFRRNMTGWQRQFDRGLNPNGVNPFDSRQMGNYLYGRSLFDSDELSGEELQGAGNRREGRSLIWTLNQDQTPMYAIEPRGPFGDDLYDVFRQLLHGHVTSDRVALIEQMSIPGVLAHNTAML